MRLLSIIGVGAPTQFFRLQNSRNTLLTAAALLALSALLVHPAHAADLKVMAVGLGEGAISSDPPGIQCGGACDATYSDVEVTLRATPGPRSKLKQWLGDCSKTAKGDDTCTIRMNASRSVRVEFELDFQMPSLEDYATKGHLPPDAIEKFLHENPQINTPARFLSALPREYRQNWIFMPRSESLQTGTAEFPRLLLPSVDAKHVFTIGLSRHGSYPSSHPNAIEFMQWDPDEKNFRFHEIVVAPIDEQMASVPPRSRRVFADDPKCALCHSTQNVRNPGPAAGTVAPNSPIKARGRPNWDTYDSWGGMLPFNRDRIYRDSVEEAAFRKLLDPWTWRKKEHESIRAIIEQLELQPPGVPNADSIDRETGGENDGRIVLGFGPHPFVPKLDAPSAFTAYAFDGQPGTGPRTEVRRDRKFVVLRHSTDPGGGEFDQGEGRGVNFFDRLGGGDGELNQIRIASELIEHRHGAGHKDVRPIALAVANDCLEVRDGKVVSKSGPPLGGNGTQERQAFYEFFDKRHGMTIRQLVDDTNARARSLPRRKADLQKLNLDRDGDFYLIEEKPAKGLIAQYDPSAGAGTAIGPERLRQEVFRRPVRSEGFSPATGFDRDELQEGDALYVDREIYGDTDKVALYRYFLEPLGISVDRWSMGVRGRSRTYTFADVFGTYERVFRRELRADLGLSAAGDSENIDPSQCGGLIARANSELSNLPKADALPEFVDVQRIFNKACVECHGGLDYPPYFGRGDLNLSENETPPPGESRLARSEREASASKRFIRSRVSKPGDEDRTCDFGAPMPCGGRRLSKADILTLQRWADGRPASIAGNSHITTVEGVDYDFQGAGEFVLLRGEGLEIQARQVGIETEAPLALNAHTGLSSCASVVNAVAVKAGGQRITYQSRIGASDQSPPELRVDGKPALTDGKQTILQSGLRIVRTAAPGGIQIELPGGTAVTVIPGWLEGQKVWQLSINVRHAAVTEGLMGAIRRGHWLPALPNGSSIGPRPQRPEDRHRALYATFADAWRVNAQTSLFDYEPGTSAKTFVVEAWPGQSPKTCRLPDRARIARASPARKTLARTAAERHCGAIAAAKLRSSCIEDVMVAGEPAFSKTYALAEQARRKALGAEPVMVAPEDNKKAVAAPVTFAWSAVPHERGGSVTYLHCLWDVRKTFGFGDCTPVPADGGAGTLSTTAARLDSGKSYFWKVFAEDGHGETVESETRRFTVK